jgi:hypothetical protein
MNDSCARRVFKIPLTLYRIFSKTGPIGLRCLLNSLKGYLL